MTDALVKLLFLSAEGTAMGLLLLAIKPLIRDRCPKVVQYYLWLPVLFRLTVPLFLPDSIRLNLPVSIVHSAANVTKYPAGGWAAQSSGRAASAGILLYPTASGVPSQTPSELVPVLFTRLQPYLPKLLFCIWISGCLIAILWSLAAYWHVSRRLNASNISVLPTNSALFSYAQEYEIPVFLNPYIETPISMGLFHPRILFPEKNWENYRLDCVFLHELTHVRRGDLYIKWITRIVTSVHWFNPFMPLLRREMDRACELACDEQVLRRLKPETVRAYGESLLSSAAGAGTIRRTMSAGYSEKFLLKERLLAVLHFKRRLPVFPAVLASLLTGMCLCASCAVVPHTVSASTSYAERTSQVQSEASSAAAVSSSLPSVGSETAADEATVPTKDVQEAWPIIMEDEQQPEAHTSPFSLGMSLENVRSYLQSEHIDFTQYYGQGNSKGYIIARCDAARGGGNFMIYFDHGAVNKITNSGNTQASSQTGLRIGDTREKVWNLYGTHYDVYDGGNQGNMYVYRLSSGYFSVNFSNHGIVNDWTFASQDWNFPKTATVSR